MRGNQGQAAPKPAGRRGTISLTLGNPGCPPPAAALSAIAGASKAEQEPLSYAAPRGLPELVALLDRRLTEERGFDRQCASTVTAGASVGLAAVILATTSPGDQVLCPDPGYPAFAQLVQSLGRRLAYYPAFRGDESASFGALEAAADDLTRLLIWNAPANPTGRVASATLVGTLVEIARDHGLMILSDEVYDGLVYEGGMTSPLALAPERVFAVHSFSKTYALAGWRVGYVAAERSLLGAVTRAHWMLAMSASTLAQRAALAALLRADGYVQARCDALHALRDDVASLLAGAHGLAFEPPDGGHFFWIDVRGSGLTSREFVSRCEGEAGVILTPGTVFGPAGEGYLRLSFGGPRPVVLRGVERLVRWVRRRKSSWGGSS